MTAHHVAVAIMLGVLSVACILAGVVLELRDARRRRARILADADSAARARRRVAARMSGR